MSKSKVNENVNVPNNFEVAPATVSSHDVTLIWDKPDNYADIINYQIYQDGEVIAQQEPTRTHYQVQQLDAKKTYHFSVTSINSKHKETSPDATMITVTTAPQGHIIDITTQPYGADVSGTLISTQQLQQAINDCDPGDTVLIPDGATILSGAVDLKSNITLQVDGVLKGSLDPQDYLYDPHYASYPGHINADGMILTRYEGWEMYCYRSLINAGYLDSEKRQSVTCENIRIVGHGKIYGGGNELGYAMMKIYDDVKKYPTYLSDGRPGRRTRGRLISFIQCKNVDLSGVTVENPPCWTIHMIYCDTVTTHGLHILSRGVENGDGWDPDSSQNCMIFDTTFDTGDDCIAIKSGKNPDGNKVNIPTKNIRIFDLKMLGGNGMAIGSEQSGGVSGVYIRDCTISNTNWGLELKAHKTRGGYIKGVTVIDCTLDRFLAQSVDYNSDGEAAPDFPFFKDINVKNCRITDSQIPIMLTGFLTPGHDPKYFVREASFENIMLSQFIPKQTKIKLKACQNINFKNVFSQNREYPEIQCDEATTFNISVL